MVYRYLFGISKTRRTPDEDDLLGEFEDLVEVEYDLDIDLEDFN